jgi:hypothetical protein
MKWLKDATLAGLRWGRETLVPLAKTALAKLRILFDTVYDPPPKTIRFYFWSALALIACVWLTFAFTNSWFYKPTVQALAEFSYALSGDDGDVVLPELEPLPPVPTPAAAIETLPSVEVVCHDMSDTPHCEPVYESPEKHSMGTQTEAQANPAEKAIAYKPQKKAKAYKKRRRPAAVLTPARDDFRLVL